MHRTEGTYNQGNLFTNGPPGTRVEQNWLNAVQEEIAYVIEEAGVALLTADVDTRQQLKQSLDTLYTQLPTGTVMLFGQNLAPTGWTRKTNWANNTMLCYAATGNISSGGSANPQSGHVHGGASHTHTTGNVFLTLDQIPGHQHYVMRNVAYNTGISSSYPLAYYADYDNGQSYTIGCTTSGAANVGLSSASGGSNYHNHGTTGAGGTGYTDPNTSPSYQEVIAATKD